MTIGERIRLIRETSGEKKISMAKFAETIGVTSGAVSQWENGQKEPNKSALLLICKAFDINETWLLTGEGDMKTPMTREEKLAAIAASIYTDGDAHPLRIQLHELISDMPDDMLEDVIKIRDFVINFFKDQEAQ